MTGAPLFGFVQLEFGHLLGPADGRYLVRREPPPGQPAQDPLADEPTAVLVLGTLAAPEARLLGRRRGRTVEEAEPAPVPTTRATVVRAAPFEDGREEAARWLAGLRASGEAADAEVAGAVAVVNRGLRAHRVTSADPYAADIAAERALVVRIGFGSGDAVVEGRYAQAWELPGSRPRRRRRSMEAPEERFAALLGGREAVLASEELVLRARADLDAGRHREAALQARIALEALLAELDEITGDRRAGLEADRPAMGQLANAALEGPLRQGATTALADAVARMEAALRARRLAGSA